MDDNSGGNTNITYCDFNAFLTNAQRTIVEGGHDLTVAGYHWQSSWFGDYYLPPGSPLIDAGSTTAAQVGLYHFTTQTSQAIEGGSVADIGYHYVATDGEGNPLETLTNGVPDYLEDANGDGLPDGWEAHWFGSYPVTAGQLDAYGNTFLYDYQYGYDPNVIQFWIEATNTYLTNAQLSASLNITAGIPFYQAVLVDSTNFDEANWTAYTSSNVTANLGSAQGWHQVRIGLKGLPAEATQTWMKQEFKLDTVPPSVTITNPVLTAAAASVIKPVLQLQGLGNEPLGAISCDISNALGVISNQPGFVVGQVFNTNEFDFTTNDFQCYDLQLTNGLNVITLRVADLAGNVTTTNLFVTLDYSSATNPPVVSLVWPQDGWAVSGTNCTIRGTISDETGTIVAQVVNGDGATNTVQGDVERNGKFWLDNVPLNGTNRIRIQATDAAGNVTMTNLTIYPGEVELTIDSAPAGVDLYQFRGYVAGTVSDPDCTVWINGMEVTNYWTDGQTAHWWADDAPICGQGTATFDAAAYAPGDSPNNGARPQATANLAPVMPDWVEKGEYHENKKCTWIGPLITTSEVLSKDYVVSYAADTRTMKGDAHTRGSGISGWTDDVYHWSSDDLVGTDHHTDSDGNDYTHPIPTINPPLADIWAVPDFDARFGIGLSYSYVWQFFGKRVHYEWPQDTAGGFYNTIIELGAETRWVLHTGGRAKSGRRNLFAIVLAGCDKYHQALAGGWGDTPSEPVDPGSVTVLGGHFGGDGIYWTVLPGGAHVNLGITVPADHASVDVGEVKYTLVHQVECVAAGDTNLDRTTLGIGEVVYFSGMPDNTTWSVSGNGTISSTNGSGTTFTAKLSPGSATVTAQVGGVTIPTTFSNIAPSSITVVGHADHPFGSSVGIGDAKSMGARTYYDIIVGPTSVSFANAELRENPEPSSKNVTWPSGYQTLISFERSSFDPFSCGGVPSATDRISTGSKLFDVRLLQKPDGYLGNESFSVSWTDQYKNDSGQWTDFFTLTANYDFSASDATCRITYLGVPGSKQGPYNIEP